MEISKTQKHLDNYSDYFQKLGEEIEFIKEELRLLKNRSNDAWSNK